MHENTDAFRRLLKCGQEDEETNELTRSTNKGKTNMTIDPEVRPRGSHAFK